MRRTCIAMLAVIAAGVAICARAQQETSISIIAPTAETVVSGPTQLAVSVPRGVDVQSVSFFVDGRLACTVERPPFGCTWDAGMVVRGHHVRVVAQLADGGRLVGNLRTKDLGYTERTRVDAVLVPVIVTDGGRFVRGLKPQDFEVAEDGVPQRIAGLATEESPLDLVLAIDTSGSMEAALPEVKVAVKAFLSKLRPGDAATLLGFNDTMFMVAEREKEPRARDEAVDLLSAWGGTALYDATARAIDLVGRTPGRKGVVVFSDGDDHNSLISPEKAAATVQAGNAMMYTVGFGAGATVTTLRARLEEYAQSTGGRAFFPRHTRELETVFGTIVSELSNQYVLSYTSSNLGSDRRWRAIRVRVRSGKYDVRARRGYQVSGPLRAER